MDAASRRERDALRRRAWGVGGGLDDLNLDVAPSLTRQESDTFVAFLRALGYTAAAVREHLASDAERERRVEIREEEPEAFGAGHIVLLH